MSRHLSATAEIGHSKNFENCFVELRNDALLSATDKAQLSPFLQPVLPPETEDNDSRLRFPKSCNAQRDHEANSELGIVTPFWQCQCWQLAITASGGFFSECKYVLSPQRSSLLPANFEMLMFLKANQDLWNASTLLQ
ncbi:TPA: hypothetical protein N0F65_006222 [Lagenidium giganteum]|uniref:Uncharacterized protein n=1 Tax=Lagenidium giganteum TaxID=4803 RepID=A0AAV2Z3V0_9STRA|nr:TPA: hypothetical protein N0F65_006222 [Lagenidium giganteum]